MNLKDSCQYVSDRFIYKADVKGKWSILSGNKMSGDCEDFSLTVMFLHFGGVFRLLFALLTGKAKIWQVNSTGGLHAVGQVNDMFFDNWCMEPVSKEEFIKRTGHKFLKSYNPIYVMFKLYKFPFTLGVIILILGAVFGLLEVLN